MSSPRAATSVQIKKQAFFSLNCARFDLLSSALRSAWSTTQRLFPEGGDFMFLSRYLHSCEQLWTMNQRRKDGKTERRERSSNWFYLSKLSQSSLVRQKIIAWSIECVSRIFRRTMGLASLTSSENWKALLPMLSFSWTLSVCINRPFFFSSSTRAWMAGVEGSIGARVWWTVYWIQHKAQNGLVSDTKRRGKWNLVPRGS